jgi:hypothetical protein
LAAEQAHEQRIIVKGEKIMAITAEVAIRRISAWFTLGQPKGIVSNHLPTQNPATHERSTRVEIEDEVEAHRVRKAGLDLMKFQGVNRGY